MSRSSRDRDRQQGQIIVIFAGAAVLLILVASLVIDLGFVFMIRRGEQNAVDPAAIAAARYIRTGTGGTPDTGMMRQAACFYARQNGFFTRATANDGCIPANDGDSAILTVNYPPSAAAGSYSGRDGFVEVDITRVHHSFLAGIVGLRNLTVSTMAVGAFSSGDSNTSSLIALNPVICSAGKTHGTGDITIHPAAGVTTGGGYVHINSTCSGGTPNGQCDIPGQGGLDVAGSGTLTAPQIYVTGTCKSKNGRSQVSGPVTEGAVQIGDPLAELAAPDPADYPSGVCPDGTVTNPATHLGCTFSGSTTIRVNPGVFYGGWDVKNNATLELAPGVYIIAGGGIKNAGGNLTSVQGGSGTPAPVLIFNTDNPATHTGQADLDFNAKATLRLRPVASGPYQGILIWNDGNGSNPAAQLDLEGQVSVDIAGTIYSPKGFVKMEGGSGVGSTAAVQIIADSYDIGGNSNLDMPYDPTKLYHFDQKGLVH